MYVTKQAILIPGGRGVEKIAEACNVAPLQAPVISERSGGLVVELRKTQVKTQDAVLAVLSEEPAITLAEVAIRIGKSTSAIERAAKKLRDQGKLRYVGPQKGGYREIIE